MAKFVGLSNYGYYGIVKHVLFQTHIQWQCLATEKVLWSSAYLALWKYPIVLDYVYQHSILRVPSELMLLR